MPPKTRNGITLVRKETTQQRQQSGLRKGSRRLDMSSEIVEGDTPHLNSNTIQAAMEASESGGMESSEAFVMPPIIRNRTTLRRHEAPQQHQQPSSLQKGLRHRAMSSELLEEDTSQHNSNPNQSNCDAIESGELDPTQVESTRDGNESATKKRKRRRGATLMPKVWGQQHGKRVAISFNELGQPIDNENSSTLAHFLGTIARNGKYCPLHCKDWRLLPDSYKEDMIKLVKLRFELRPEHEIFILSSINKKWRSWKSYVKNLSFKPGVPLEQQLAELPDRVEEDQYKALFEYWMQDKIKEISQKNKEARAKLGYVHRMGKKSLARVKEEMRKRLGRYPTRAELFTECYYIPDGSPESDAILELVEQMEELAAQNPENLTGNEVIYNPEDTFAKVMGKDKDGKLRMYGIGVRSTDVLGKKPSRAALIKQSTEYKEKYLHVVEKYDTLSAGIKEFKAYVNSKLQTNGQPLEVEGAQVESSNELHNSQSPPLTTSNTQRSSPLTSRRVRIGVGSFVVLKDLGGTIVANGIVSVMENVSVNGINLGPQFCEIVIQIQVKKEVPLLFPYGHFQTIGDTLGAPVVWPLHMVALDEDES